MIQRVARVSIPRGTGDFRPLPVLATLPPLLKRRLRRPAPFWAAILATAAGLIAAYLLKRPCIVNPWADNFQYIHLCYNDIQPLFGVRGISHGLIPYVDVEMEYPVLTGMFMDFTGRVLRALSWVGLAEFSNETISGSAPLFWRRSHLSSRCSFANESQPRA
jgi:hypothetical protein